MPHRRRVKKGSFGSHFDELVAQFPSPISPPRPNEPMDRSSKLQEKLDIHTWLFERAWRIEDEGGGAR